MRACSTHSKLFWCHRRKAVGLIGAHNGLSVVHVNRTLKALRTEGLITFKSGQLVVLDAARLRAINSFNPSYLHLAECEPDVNASL